MASMRQEEWNKLMDEIDSVLYNEDKLSVVKPISYDNTIYFDYVKELTKDVHPWIGNIALKKPVDDKFSFLNTGKLSDFDTKDKEVYEISDYSVSDKWIVTNTKWQDAPCETDVFELKQELKKQTNEVTRLTKQNKRLWNRISSLSIKVGKGRILGG